MGIPLNKQSNEFAYRYSWFHLARPLTLSGTISPILVGTAFAAQKGPIQLSNFIIVLTATLLIQIATNIFNDYFDFKGGQDKQKWTTIRETKMAPIHKDLPIVAGALIFVAILLGLWLALQSELWIIIVGVLGIAGGFCYSAGKYALSSIGLGEVIAAIFLGFATTILPYIVQGNELTLEIFVVAVPFALLIATMILTNNIRDIKKDNGFRHTIAIVIGKKRAIHILTALLILIYMWIIGLVFFNIIPTLSLVVFLAIPFAIRLLRCFLKSDTPQKEMMGMKCATYHHYTI